MPKKKKSVIKKKKVLSQIKSKVKEISPDKKSKKEDVSTLEAELTGSHGFSRIVFVPSTPAETSSLRQNAIPSSQSLSTLTGSGFESSDSSEETSSSREFYSTTVSEDDNKNYSVSESRSAYSTGSNKSGRDYFSEQEKEASPIKKADKRSENYFEEKKKVRDMFE